MRRSSPSLLSVWNNEASSSLGSKSAAPRDPHHRLRELFKTNVIYAVEDFLASICFNHTLINFRIDLELVPFRPAEDEWWMKQRPVGRGEYGSTHVVTYRDVEYLVKEVRGVPTRTPPGMWPVHTAEEATYQECAVLFAMSIIGNSATVRLRGVFADVSCDPWKFYIGMDYIAGDTAWDGRYRLTLEQRLLAVAELGFLLEYFAIYKIFHNDMHSGNVMLRKSDGRVALIDYGSISVGAQSPDRCTDLDAYLNIVDLLFDEVPESLRPRCVKDLLTSRPRSAYHVGECLRTGGFHAWFHVGQSMEPAPGPRRPGTMKLVPLPTKLVLPTSKRGPETPGLVAHQPGAFLISAYWDRIQLAPQAFRCTVDTHLQVLQSGGPLVGRILRWLGDHVQELVQWGKSRLLRQGLKSCNGTAFYRPALCVSALRCFAELHRLSKAEPSAREPHQQQLDADLRELQHLAPSIPREVFSAGTRDEIANELRALLREDCALPQDQPSPASSPSSSPSCA